MHKLLQELSENILLRAAGVSDANFICWQQEADTLACHAGDNWHVPEHVSTLPIPGYNTDKPVRTSHG